MPLTKAKCSSAKSCKKIKFAIGEKILCYQGPHLYEAKCLKRQVVNKQIKFLVHYSKWKPKYDEWVTEERMLKYSPANLKVQQELRQKATSPKLSANNNKSVDNKNDAKSKIPKTNSSESLNIIATANTTSKKLTTPLFVCNQSDFLNMQEVKIRIPEDLKPILVDDWELVANQNKLLPLPPKFNIDKILSNYFFQKTQTSKLPLNHTIEGYNNFLSNIRKYFNYLLEKHLLYPMEQGQLAYLKNNYDSLTLQMKEEETINSHKESRRAWKKYKKSHFKKQQTAKKVSVPIESNSNEKDLVSEDQTSQTETSDSCATNENANKDRQIAPQSLELEAVTQEVVDMDKHEEKRKIDYTKLYGAIHLLRLFSKLNHFLFYTDLNEERLALLTTYIYDFLKYLSKNLWTFWNYSDASYVDSSVFTVNDAK